MHQSNMPEPNMYAAEGGVRKRYRLTFYPKQSGVDGFAARPIGSSAVAPFLVARLECTAKSVFLSDLSPLSGWYVHHVVTKIKQAPTISLEWMERWAFIYPKRPHGAINVSS